MIESEGNGVMADYMVHVNKISDELSKLADAVNDYYDGLEQELASANERIRDLEQGDLVAANIQVKAMQEEINQLQVKLDLSERKNGAKEAEIGRLEDEVTKYKAGESINYTQWQVALHERDGARVACRAKEDELVHLERKCSGADKALNSERTRADKAEVDRDVETSARKYAESIVAALRSQLEGAKIHLSKADGDRLIYLNRSRKFEEDIKNLEANRNVLVERAEKAEKELLHVRSQLGNGGGDASYQIVINHLKNDIKNLEVRESAANKACRAWEENARSGELISAKEAAANAAHLQSELARRHAIGGPAAVELEKLREELDNTKLERDFARLYSIARENQFGCAVPQFYHPFQIVRDGKVLTVIEVK